MMLERTASALLILLFLVSVPAVGADKASKSKKSDVGPKRIAGTSKFAPLADGAGFPAFAPKIVEKGELLIPSGFTKGEGPSGLGKQWIIGNGEWEIRGDAVTTMKAEGADHSAGLRSDIGELPDRFILEFKFRFDSDDANKDGKHKFNLRVMGNGKALVLHPTEELFVARTMAEGGGSVFHVEKEVKLARDKWYSVMVEVKDEDCCVQLSDVGQFDFRHEQIKKRKKKFFVFNVGFARASVKDVKFWGVK